MKYAVGARIDELASDLRPIKLDVLGDRESIPLDHDITVAPFEEIKQLTSHNIRKERRRMFAELPYCSVPGFYPICLDSNDAATVEAGFLKRLLRVTPKCDDALLLEFTMFVDEFLRTNLIPLSKVMTFKEWLDSLSFNEARKAELADAFEKLMGGRPTKKQRQTVQSFVKTESYPEYKNCRMINSRSDAFKAYSGRFFKSIENAVYQLPEFIKHTPVPERPAMILALRQANRRYYQTDFTAFESHFNKKFMEACELRLYAYMLKNFPSDARCICNTIGGVNRMKTRTGVRAKVVARRMSGDMCTSLGNGFSNLMLAKFLAARQGKTLTGFVEGDDGLFATDAILDEELYAKLGFTIKIQAVRDPCEASFCGMIFADSGEIIKDPKKFLSTFGWSSSFVSAGTLLKTQLLRAKALSAVYEAPQCPLLGALARYALENTRGVTARFVQDGYHTVPKDEAGLVGSLKTYCPAYDTRLLFERQYGVSVAVQLIIEERFSRGVFEVRDLIVPPSDQVHFGERYIELGG